MTRSSPPRTERRSEIGSAASERQSDTHVTFLGHATTLIEVSGLRILTDPFLRSSLGPLERHGAVPDPAELDVDAVLISHGHRDHFDRWSIEALPGNPTIIVPQGLASSLKGWSTGRVIQVAAGDCADVSGITVTAVRARHWISPGAAPAQPIGYVFDAGPRVYFAGDTGRFAGLGDAAGGVDVAFLPVWTWGPHLGPGHLGPRSAAEVAKEIAPAAAVPIHWGTLYPRHLHRVWRRALIEPGDRFAGHVSRLAPDVEVRVLRPGESTTIRRLAPAR